MERQDSMSEASSHAAGALKPGERIGKYEIREQLGSGGQAIVYKAYDALLDRFVAIKQIAPNLAQDEDYRRDLQENIRKIARLGQKNEAIVTIHELIEDDRGLFYVMEFVEGHTLETLLRESDGPIEVKATVLILFRLAAALHDVHGEGICHRDMKPSNVILTEGLRPKIIDFGVAAATGGEASMPLATTKYLAPEVYEDRTVDGRSDIYSLGFIVYEMLLGRKQFHEIFADVVRDRHSEAVRWMKWHGNEQVTAPLLHEVNPAVPLALSRIVDRMIHKNPDQRYASTEELGRDIKKSFSPKTRKGPAETPARPQPKPSARDETISRLREPTGIGSLEGEELEVPAAGEETGQPEPLHATPRQASEDHTDLAEGPATAPLPPQPMTKRRKVALLLVAAGLFAVVLGGGVWWMLQIRARNAARRQSAGVVYKQAMDEFKQQNYIEAREGFEDVLARHPQTLQGRLARVMAPMARAHLAIETGRWDTAQLEERDAEQATQTLQAETADKKVADWTRTKLDDIEQIRQKRHSYRAFAEAVARAESALAQPVPPDRVEEHFRDIQRNLEDALSLAGVELTPEQDRAVAELRRRIERQRVLTQVNALLARGDEHIDAGHLTEADQAYAQARGLLQGEDPAVALLGKDQRADLLETVRTRRKDITGRARTQQALQAITQAEQDKDTAALRSALQKALELETLSQAQRRQFTQRLKDLRIEEALGKARRLIGEGNTAGAREALKRVLALAPEHEEATTLLGDLDRRAKRTDLIRQGDQAYTAREFDKALQFYRQAAKTGPSETLKTKIADCLFELKLAEADQLVQQGLYPQAESAYARAKEIRPARSDDVDARLLTLRTRRQYQRFIEEGDEAMKANRWQDAVRWYTQAQQTINTAEVAKRIDLTNYKKFITQGKEALQEEDFAVARWNFKQALNYMDTPEARELLTRAEQERSE
jgi:serine/threonine protein kinase